MLYQSFDRGVCVMTLSDFAKTALCRVYQTAAFVPKAVVPAKERDILKGTGSIKKLPIYIKRKNIDSVLIVVDPALKGSDLLSSMTEKLNEAEISHITFSPSKTTITSAMFEQCAQAYTDSKCKAIIAVGGGSVIDWAKLVGVKAVRPKADIANMKGFKPLMRKLPPIFAVPTTAGSGSESSNAAVCYDKKQKRRNVTAAPALKPAAVVMDPAVAQSLPADIMAQTAMATLCRAVETYIGVMGTKSARDDAKLAVRLVFANIKNANEKEAFAELQKASYIAGSLAGYAHYGALCVSAACHVSYAGAASALLPEVLKAYGESAYKRLAQLADSVNIKGETDREKAEAFIKAIEALNEKFAIPAKLRQLKKNSIEKTAQKTASYCNPSYAAPKQLFFDDICELLQKIRA